ncbi:MAG: hypothetical protein ACI351_02990 [Candidatus Avelusimicrobium sp.]|uniref:hypothetical protein n=1 Tax=Candidatus Avelusimicrobium sp. TaxID=3048833 RepID=UPI003EFD1814
MKKLLVMLLALTVLGLPAFAQTSAAGKDPVNTAYRKVAQAVFDTQDEIAKGKEAVLNSLKYFRKVTEERKEFNGSFSLQDMMSLMDSYLDLYSKSQAAALSLNEEINKPIKAGWGSTVTIPQLIRDNIQYVFPGTSTADDLDTFEFLLCKKPEKPASQK